MKSRINPFLLNVKSQLLKVKREPLRGFTLIELVVVLAMMGILLSAGITSFESYVNNQTFNSAVSDVAGIYNIARSRSVSQTKPSECANKRLSGYQVNIVNAQYILSVLCEGDTYVIQSKNLPPGVIFENGSTPMVIFSAISGAVAADATITLSGFQKNKAITINQAGTISVN